MPSDKVNDYQALLEWYQQGLYTNGELISKSLELLFKSANREALWQAFMPQHREVMAQLLNEFDQSAEPFAIKADSKQVWREMSALKGWLAER